MLRIDLRITADEIDVSGGLAVAAILFVKEEIDQGSGAQAPRYQTGFRGLKFIGVESQAPQKLQFGHQGESSPSPTPKDRNGELKNIGERKPGNVGGNLRRGKFRTPTPATE